MAAQRSPWMNERAELLVKLLDERYGLAITEPIARRDISDHVEDVADAMGIGQQAAKVYVTEDTIRELADRIGLAVEKARAEQDQEPTRHLRVVRD